MYNAHRAMAQPANRLEEYINGIRQEFEKASSSNVDADQRIQSQMQEMEMVRQKVYELERNQQVMKQRYEEDVIRLRHELEAKGGPGAHIDIRSLPAHSGAVHPPPPAIGHGPSNLFGGIMSNSGGQGQPGLAPLPQEQPQQPQQQPLPPQQPGPPPQQQISQSHQQVQQQGHYPGYPPQPVVNGYGPQNQMPSPGGAKSRGPVAGRGHGSTPQQTQAMPYANASSPPVGRHSPPPPQYHHVGNTLADLHPDDMRPDQKREGMDWYAVFNPNVRRVLDIELAVNLTHESVVCCVRFSHDGTKVATGCNRSAQIFDVATGNKLTTLTDNSVDKEGDLYIRSVCFSPDGAYLATGAEDKLIRVWDIASRTIRHSFSGHEQDIYSLDFSRSGRLIASGSGDHTVRVWDLTRGGEILTLSIEDGVTTVAISPNGEFVAAGSLDKSVRVWEITSGNVVCRLDGPEGHKDSVYSVAFSPDGECLVSGSLDKTIKMWQLAPDSRSYGSRGGRCIRTFEGHKDFVLSVALTPDNDWVLSGSKDRGVQFWNPRTGDAQLMLQGHKNSVISVAPSPTGELFATGSGDMRARIWRYSAYRG